MASFNGQKATIFLSSVKLRQSQLVVVLKPVVLWLPIT